MGPRAAGDVEGFEAAGGKVAAAKEEVVVAKDEVAAAEAKVVVAKEEVAVAEAKVVVAKDEVAAAKDEVAVAEAKVVVAKDEVAAAEAKVAVAKEEVVVAEAADNAQAISWAHQTMNVALRSLDSAQAGLEEATRAWKNANAAVASTQVTLDGAQHRLAKLLDGYDAAMEGA